MAEADFPHDPIDDGWELALGAVTLRALHTPGHRPEHTSFAVIDTSRGPEPWAVLTGDSMFVGSVARPDLAVEPHEGAREIFRSLHESLLALPPEVEVWPGHLGGSMCGGPGMSMKISSTIGYERANNALLGEMDEATFVERSLADIGPQPPNFREIVAINRGPLASLDVHDRPLTPGQLLHRQAAGALVVDVRADLLFDDAHVPGAVSVTAQRSGFGTRLAWLVGPGREVALVGRDDEEARHAAGLAVAVGVRGGGGYLAGGMSGWRNEGRPVERIARITVPELAARRARDPGLQILDVRETGEWAGAHIPGSVNLPYHALEQAGLDIDLDRPIAVICGAGHRSAVGASLIQRRGAREPLHVIDGGVTLWRELGYEMDAGAPVAR